MIRWSTLIVSLALLSLSLLASELPPLARLRDQVADSNPAQPMTEYQRRHDDVRHIEFAEAIALTEVASSAAAARVRVVAFGSQIGVGSTSIADFIVLRGDEHPEEIVRELAAYRLAALNDTEANAATLDPVDSAAVLAQVREARATVLRQRDISSDILVRDVTVTGASWEIDDFIRLRPGATPTPRIDQPRDLAPSTDDARVATQAVAATWYPNSGSAVVWSSGSGSSAMRMAQNFMKWNNPTFTSTQTYEHDFFAYNYDRKSYLNTASTAYPDCFPVPSYGQTNWPTAARPYLDTRFDGWRCEVDEVPFTLGVAKANQLKAGAIYYTYFNTKPGNASSSKFKLQAQRGYRDPTFCYTTWCSQNDKIVTLIPYTKFPGTVYWAKP